MESDKVVLSYHDSLLRQSDVSLLQPGKWLNDRIIGFAFERFEQEKFHASVDKVAFISPDVTQFIKLASGAEVGIFVEPLGLADKSYVFLAVNDNSSMESAGGSHWSLLLYNRSEGTFYHYDSSGGFNMEDAKQIARKVEPYIKAKSKVKFEECKSPQQVNSSDCGMYVISIAEHLASQYLASQPDTLTESLTPDFIRQKRCDLEKLIQQLGEQSVNS